MENTNYKHVKKAFNNMFAYFFFLFFLTDGQFIKYHSFHQLSIDKVTSNSPNSSSSSLSRSWGLGLLPRGRRWSWLMW